jgi:serine/threonine protein kinase
MDTSELLHVHRIPLSALELDFVVVLGSGSFGRVLDGKWHPAGNGGAIKVAVKQYYVAGGEVSPAELRSAMLAEAARMMQLGSLHPHILPAYGVVDEVVQGTPFFGLVMPRRKASLYAALRRGLVGLSAAQRQVIMVQLVDALALAHACGVVHADLTSLNVLLDDADNAYLADFGDSELRRHMHSTTGILTLGGKGTML